MKILFVCSGNASRSVVAEALLKKARPDLDVDSAGTGPASTISTIAEKYMAQENAEEYLKKGPEGLQNKRLAEYDLIITMETSHRDAVLSECPECTDKILVWDLEDPYFLPKDSAEKIFDQIKMKARARAKTWQIRYKP
ncbi:MAG: hypothetical protein PVF96_05985 [Candidatus Bathyarchaeota archaeon]